MTDEELKHLDEIELDEAKHSAEIILALFAVLQKDLESLVYTLFGRYAVDGRLSLTEMKHALNAKELMEFNRKHDDDYKRLTRLNAFYYELDDLIDTLRVGYRKEVESLGRVIAMVESDAFGVSLEDIIEDVVKARWSLDKNTFGERIDLNMARLYAQLAVEIKQRLAVGATVGEVLADIDKRLGIAKRAANNFVLTEASAFNTTALRQTFLILGIIKYKYYAMEDERTCDICGELHGKTFIMSNYEIGVTAPPMHKNCRCRIEPIVD